jgi:hypothetical protein
MNRIEILTEQARNYADEFLLEMLEAATDPNEIVILEIELNARTTPAGTISLPKPLGFFGI